MPCTSELAQLPTPTSAIRIFDAAKPTSSTEERKCLPSRDVFKTRERDWCGERPTDRVLCRLRSGGARALAHDLEQELHQLGGRLRLRLLERVLPRLEAGRAHLRVGLADARREEPEALQVGHDLREGHLAEADHEGCALGPLDPGGHVPAEPLEDRLHQEPLAEQVARLDYEVLPLPELLPADLVSIDVLERDHAERHVPRLVAHDARRDLLDQRLSRPLEAHQPEGSECETLHQDLHAEEG